MPFVFTQPGVLSDADDASMIDTWFNNVRTTLTSAFTQAGEHIFGADNQVNHDLGSGRMFTDDRSVAPPTAPASHEEGRLWRNSEAGYAGQVYWHNGTIWVPHFSERRNTKKSTANVGVQPNTAWTDYDTANLQFTFDCDASTEDWAYLLDFQGSFNLETAAGTLDLLEVQIEVSGVADGDEVAAYGAYYADTSIANPLGLDVNLHGWYQATTAETKTITVRVKAVTNVANGVRRFPLGGGFAPHYLSIQEVVAV